MHMHLKQLMHVYRTSCLPNVFLVQINVINFVMPAVFLFVFFLSVFEISVATFVKICIKSCFEISTVVPVTSILIVKCFLCSGMSAIDINASWENTEVAVTKRCAPRNAHRQVL